ALVDTTLPRVVHHQGPDLWHDHAPMAGAATVHTLAGNGRGGVFDGADVALALDALLGGELAAEDGLQALLAAQAVARGISMPALSSAAVCLAAHLSSAAMNTQGVSPGSEMLGARSRLGRLAAIAYRQEAERRFVGAGLGLGYRPVLLTSLLELYSV